MSINRLHLACSENDLRFLSNYIESGKKDYEPIVNGSNILHISAFHNSTKCLKYILDNCKDININDKNDLGSTPLHSAVKNANIESIQILLDHKIDITIEDCSGKTAQKIAMKKNYYDCAELIENY